MFFRRRRGGMEKPGATEGPVVIPASVAPGVLYLQWSVISDFLKPVYSF